MSLNDMNGSFRTWADVSKAPFTTPRVINSRKTSDLDH